MNYVLADTSVWVELFRGADSPAVSALADLLRNKLVFTHGIVQVELLSGTGTDDEYEALRFELSALRSLEDPPEVWDRVARARYRLARRGHHAAISDLLLAVTAAHHGCPILTLDSDFERIKTVVPITLHRAISH